MADPMFDVEDPSKKALRDFLESRFGGPKPADVPDFAPVASEALASPSPMAPAAAEATPVPDIALPAAQDPKFGDLMRALDQRRKDQTLQHIGNLAAWSGDIMRGRSRGLPQAPEDEFTTFLTKRALQASDPLEALKAEKLRADIDAAKSKPPDWKDQPAPAEWGAGEGVTVGQAMAMGYGKAPKPIDADDYTASPDQIEELQRKGYPTWPGMTVKEYKQAAGRVYAAEKANEAAVAASGRQVSADAAKDAQKREAGRAAAKAAFGNDWIPRDNSPLLEDDTMRRDFLTSTTDAAEMRGLAQELKRMIYGGLGPTSTAEEKARARSIVARLQLLQKSIDKLGVLSAVDISEFLAPQLANPAGWDTVWQKWSGQYDPKGQIDQYIANMDQKLRQKSKSLSVDPAPRGSFADLTADAGSGGGESVREVKTKEERDALPVGARYRRAGDPTVYVKTR